MPVTLAGRARSPAASHRPLPHFPILDFPMKVIDGLGPQLPVFGKALATFFASTPMSTPQTARSRNLQQSSPGAG